MSGGNLGSLLYGDVSVMFAFFVVVFDLLHDVGLYFDFPTQLITVSGNFFGNMSGRFTCETTICIFMGITHISEIISLYCKQ